MDLSPYRQTIVLSVIVVLLQIILAPNLQIGNALPNFITSFVVAYVLVYNRENHYVLAFVLGMVSDLLGNSALGLAALCLLIAAAIEGLIGRNLGNDNLVMSIGIMLVAVFGVELVYALFLVTNGAAEFADAMLFRVLPCTLYSTTLAVVWYLVLMRRSSIPAGGIGAVPHGSSRLRFH